MAANSDKRLRYPKTVDPVATDGRDVDIKLATLAGEASHQEAGSADQHIARLAPEPWDRVPLVSGDDATYYDRPVIKPSVWSLDIPLYYFVGGAAGAALTLGAALQLVTPRGSHELRRLSKLCHWTGIVGSTGGAAFLIHDLGRPMRFLMMMRVFRPTSPMNMGVWILSGAAPTAIVTGVFANRKGVLGDMAELTGYLSGIFGAALAGYTGVLVSNTVIPIWQPSRRWLPPLFVASSMATAASVVDVFGSKGRPSRTATWMFGTAGRIAELAAAKQVERAASDVPKVGEPFHNGGASVLWKASTALTVTSLVLTIMPGKSTRRRRIAGILGAAGSLCLRLAVHYLGDVSAREPRATFHQQRASLAAAAAAPATSNAGETVTDSPL
jgi:formate-dependent nitrite reductase membrane component NrfD